ncbi:MAG: hypothetical protein ACK58L_14290 [Planctomycetota bacterium]
MKPVKISTLVLSLFLSASAMAQPPESRGPGRPEGRPGEGGPGGREGREGGRFRMPNPLADAIDKDKNGELSPEEIADAATALKTLDRNNDGKIDSTEMRPNFEGMGRGGFGGPGGEAGADGAEMVQRLMEMDSNKDGKLQKDELPERLQSMFARGDKNTDGVLDKEEMMATVRDRVGGSGGSGAPGFNFAQMMERADTDKDGKLSGDEIPPFMKGRLEQIDTNKDGALDQAELEASAARMRGGRGGEGGGRGRGQRPPVEGSDENKNEE